MDLSEFHENNNTIKFCMVVGTVLNLLEIAILAVLIYQIMMGAT